MVHVSLLAHRASLNDFERKDNQRILVPTFINNEPQSLPTITN